MHAHRSAFATALTLTAFLLACTTPRTRPADVDETGPYPAAMWRLNPPAVSNVFFDLAHIVIAHRDSAQLDGLPWTPELAANRGREEARALALRIRRGLSGTLPDFTEAARRYSDDRLTRADGGRLGNTAVGYLANEYRDAVFALPEGGISRVFETPAGFHIVRRNVPEPEVVMRGKAIVISHASITDATSSLRFSERSRQGALAIANAVADQLRRTPDRFEALASKYSDLAERTDGDLGPVSTHRGNLWPAIGRELSLAQVGECRGPIDTPWGFYVVCRTQVVPEERIAATWILVPGSDAGSFVESVGLAQRVLESLQRAPTDADFGTAAQQYCQNDACRMIRRQWSIGQRDPGLEYALQATAPGNLVPQVIATAAGSIVVRRDEPSTHPDERPLLTAVVPKLEYRPPGYFLSTLDGEALADYARLLGSDLESELHLKGTAATETRGAFDRAAASLTTAAQGERQQVIATLERQLNTILGPAAFAQYRTYRAKWAQNKQLGL